MAMIPKNDFIEYDRHAPKTHCLLTPRESCSKVFKLKVGEGENSKTFFIHPDLLAKRSKSFVMDCWEKGLDEMVMPDSDPQVVANYMHIVQVNKPLFILKLIRASWLTPFSPERLHSVGFLGPNAASPRTNTRPMRSSSTCARSTSSRKESKMNT